MCEERIKLDSEQMQGKIEDLDSGITYLRLAIEELCDTLIEHTTDDELKTKIEKHKLAILHSY